MDKKMLTTTDQLCRGFPSEFSTYMNYVRALRFDDKPDYSYLRKLFRDLYIREGYVYDYIFDWTVMKLAHNTSTAETGGREDAEKKRKDASVGRWVTEIDQSNNAVAQVYTSIA
jgi:casein kinase I homolog HRR25